MCSCCGNFLARSTKYLNLGLKWTLWEAEKLDLLLYGAAQPTEKESKKLLGPVSEKGRVCFDDTDV